MGPKLSTKVPPHQKDRPQSLGKSDRGPFLTPIPACFIQNDAFGQQNGARPQGWYRKPFPKIFRELEIAHIEPDFTALTKSLKFSDTRFPLPQKSQQNG